MKSVCKKDRSTDKHIQEGLRILAKIIIRKYINKTMEKEGDGNSERICNRSTIYDQ